MTASVRAEANAVAFPNGGQERLRADLERLGSLGLFSGRGRARDAAPTLNGLVAADGPVEGTTPAWWAENGAFAAFEPVAKEWWAHPEITGSYDLSFLRDWRRFDHWE